MAPVDKQASSNGRAAADRRPRPWRSAIGWLAFGLVAGWLYGFGLLGQGYRSTFSENQVGLALLLLPVVLVGVVMLGLWAALKRSWGPAIALAALVASCSAGYGVRPEVEGTLRVAPGTAAIGTLIDPAGQWSGDATCSWWLGDATVGSVAFKSSDRPLAPPDLVGPPKRDIERAYPAKLASLGLHWAPRGYAVVSWEYGSTSTTGSSAVLDVLEFADNGQTGRVDVGVDGLVISWTCEDGPQRGQIYLPRA